MYKNIKIYEMLLRDGLQSLPKIYRIEKKLELYNLIKETNISFIEFGSTTSKNILPQMSNSYELYDFIKHDRDDKNLIILCTSLNGLKKSLNININNYSLVCSLSDDFSKHNLHCLSDISFSKILEQLDLIIKTKFNLVRIYISCSFGCVVDSYDNISKPEDFTFDIIMNEQIPSNSKKFSDIPENILRNPENT